MSCAPLWPQPDPPCAKLSSSQDSISKHCSILWQETIGTVTSSASWSWSTPSRNAQSQSRAAEAAMPMRERWVSTICCRLQPAASLERGRAAVRVPVRVLHPGLSSAGWAWQAHERSRNPQRCALPAPVWAAHCVSRPCNVVGMCAERLSLREKGSPIRLKVSALHAHTLSGSG